MMDGELDIMFMRNHIDKCTFNYCDIYMLLGAIFLALQFLSQSNKVEHEI